MIPTKSPYANVRFEDGVFELSCVTDDWDKQGQFDETMYIHYVNLGLSVLEGDDKTK